MDKDLKQYCDYLKASCPEVKSCMQQARLLAKYMGAKAYYNDNHAFVVQGNKIYDSTNISINGMYASTKAVKSKYGLQSEWKELV